MSFEIRCNKTNKKGGKCKKLIAMTKSKDIVIEFKCPSCHNLSTYDNGVVK